MTRAEDEVGPNQLGTRHHQLNGFQVFADDGSLMSTSNGVPHRSAGWYTDGAYTVVWARGEIDLATAPDLRQALAEAVDRPGPRLVVDLTAVTFMDSSGLNLLLGAWRATQAFGGDIRLVGACNGVRRVIDIMQVDRILPNHATVAAAVLDSDEAELERD